MDLYSLFAFLVGWLFFVVDAVYCCFSPTLWPRQNAKTAVIMSLKVHRKRVFLTWIYTVYENWPDFLFCSMIFIDLDGLIDRQTPENEACWLFTVDYCQSLKAQKMVFRMALENVQRMILCTITCVITMSSCWDIFCKYLFHHLMCNSSLLTSAVDCCCCGEIAWDRLHVTD